MAFFWHDKQLFTKKGSIDVKDDGWTTFLMDISEPMKINIYSNLLKNVEEFARFLANSLGFMENLREIFVCFNDKQVISLSKDIKEPISMRITSEFNKFFPQELFQLTSVNIRDVKLDITRLIVPTKFSAEINYQIERLSIFFKIASGNLAVKVNNEFSSKMERITKKKPPSNTTIQMIFTGFDKYNSSGDYISPVFKDLLPYPEQGRIYISFSTHQTTGCCSHLLARIIPT
ncbi:hypothetical protein C1645_842030, partial [Glomus cerebriforme]